LFLEEVFACIYRTPSFWLSVAAASWKRLYNCGRIWKAEESDAVSLDNLFRVVNLFTELIFDRAGRLRYPMHSILPSTIGPPHQQVPYINQNCFRFWVNMNELPALFDTTSCCLVRRTHVRYFKTANILLEEECQGAKVGVRWTSDSLLRP
jgi:hypothetical protein